MFVCFPKSYWIQNLLFWCSSYFQNKIDVCDFSTHKYLSETLMVTLFSEISLNGEPNVTTYFHPCLHLRNTSSSFPADLLAAFARFAPKIFSSIETCFTSLTALVRVTRCVIYWSFHVFWEISLLNHLPLFFSCCWVNRPLTNTNCTQRAIYWVRVLSSYIAYRAPYNIKFPVLSTYP